MFNQAVTYQPDNSIKRGYARLIKDIFQEIYNNRWLTYQLFRRDFLANYQQSVLGTLWAVIIPLTSVAVFVFLRQAGVLSVGKISAPYPVFIMMGLSLWQIFTIGLIASAGAIVNAGSMVAKINFSKKSLVLAATGQTIVSFMIQLILTGLICLIYHFAPHPLVMLLPVLAIPLLLLTLGLGFIVALFNAVMRDVGNALSVLLPLLLFVTPILYVQSPGLLATINHYNLFYYLITLPRDLAIAGSSALWPGYLISTGITIIIFFICVIIFHLTETRIAERA